MKEKFTIIADSRVKADLKESRDFLNTKRKTGVAYLFNHFCKINTNICHAESVSSQFM